MKKLSEICKEKKVKLASIVLAIVLVATSIVYTMATQKVSMTVTQVPNINVVLAATETDVDLSNFKNDLLSSLSNVGIPKEKVNITQVEAQQQVTEETFEWQTDTMNESIGKITIEEDGRNVVLTGNSTNAGKNAIYIMPTGMSEQEFKFDYTLDFGDSFHAAGMLLRVEKTNKVLKGYMLSLNNISWEEQAGDNNAAIWEFEFPIGDNSKNFTKKLVKGLTISHSGNLQVKANSKEITVSGGGLSSPVVCELEKSYGPGYGFFSDHYATYTDEIGSFKISNINLQAVAVKSYTEVLNVPEWTDGAAKVLIDVSDVSNAQFTNKVQLSEIISRLMNDDIHYIGWGTNTNKAEMQNTISKNDDKGLFINNSDYNAAITATAKYIKESLINASASNYIIAGEDVEVKIDPSSEATDAVDEDFPSGKWKVVHNYEYFENNEGQYVNSGLYTKDVITEFPKPGSYKVYYEDDLVTEIFAHREPVASFDMKKVGNTLTLTSTSFDLDKQSNNNGIALEKWSYKEINDTNWTSGKLTSLNDNSTYIVKLVVKDHQGIWSKPATKFVSTGDETLNPVAQFKVVNRNISIYKDLELVDTSYDPKGLDLTTKLWTVTKNGSTVYTGATPVTNFSTYGTGTYQITLVVKNSEGSTSDSFSETITVTADTKAPELIVDKKEAAVAGSSIEVNIVVSDSESGVKSYKYAITNSKDTPSNWTTQTNSEASSVNMTGKITISGLGRWYLHIKTLDNANNESEDIILGIYAIEKGYTLHIQAVDELTNVGLEGVKLKVTGVYSDGRQITLDTNAKTTNANGKLTLENIPLADVSTLKIENTTALAGYEINETKILVVDVSSNKMEVKSDLSTVGLKTSVNEAGDEVTVNYPLTKKKFNLKVTTVDESNSDIKLSNAEYVLKYKGKEVGRATSIDGEAIITAPIGLATGVADDFILQQTKSANGYKTTSNTTLSISFYGDGSVLSIKKPTLGGNKQVTIPDSKNAEIIVKNTRGAEGTFALNMEVSDEENLLTKIVGSVYKIKVETDTGLSYVTESKQTDKNGNIVFSNLFGIGKIKLTFIHESAPTGYGVTTAEKYITIENNDGTISYNNASIAGIFYKVENKTVYTNLTNGKKESANSIRIKVYDSTSPETGIEGIDFKVYKLIGSNKIGAGTTNENGEILLDNIKVDGQGEVVYKLTPENQTITDINKNILFSITYNAKGEAISAQGISGTSGINISLVEEDSATLFRRIAEVKISAIVKQSMGDTILTISKTEDQTGIPIEGSQYRIRIKDNSTGAIYTKSYTTDSKGQFSLNVPETTNSTIKITETKAAEGYTLDETTKELTLKVNSTGSLVPIESTYVNLDKGSVVVSDEGAIKINIKEQGVSLRYPKVKFKIVKTDTTGTINLGGVNFKISNSNTGDFQNVATASNGCVESSTMLVKEAVDQVFEIEETRAYPGYQLPNKPYTIRIPFKEENGIIKYTGDLYEVGDELLAGKNAEYNSKTNELEITLTIRNKKEDSSNADTYGIDIKKLDPTGKNYVSGAKYNIELRPYGIIGSSTTQEILDTETNRVIEIESVKLTEDKTTILLAEVEPGIGCGEDKNIKVLTVVRNADGTLGYDPNSTSSDLKVNITSITLDDGSIKPILEVTIIGKGPEDSNLFLKEVSATENGTKVMATQTGALSYEVSLKGSVTDTELTIVTGYATTQVSINGDPYTTNTQTKKIGLPTDTTIATASLLSEDGTKTQTYTIVINRVADLGLLSVQTENVDSTLGTVINTAEKINDLTYKVELLETYTDTSINVKSVDETAKITINSEAKTEGSASSKVNLTSKTTTVTIKVENGEETQSKTYSLIIVKGDTNLGVISSEFMLKDVTVTDNGNTKNASQTSNTTYEVSVSETLTNTDLTVTTNNNESKVSIDGSEFAVNTQTKNISLTETTTTVKVTIQNADGSKTQDFTITINKGTTQTPSSTAELGLLNVQTEHPGSEDTIINIAEKVNDITYKIEVLKEYTDALVRVNPVDNNAKVTINEENTVTGEATSTVVLTNNTTVVTIKVESPNGNGFKTYSFIIIKGDKNSGSINSKLMIKDVTVTDNGSTKKASQLSATQYEVNVSGNLTTTDLTITTKDASSTVSINGETFAVNTQTKTIGLIDETTTVKVRVQSADSSEIQEYTVVIKKDEEITPVVPSTPSTPTVDEDTIEILDDNGEVISKAYKVDSTTYRVEVLNSYLNTTVRVTPKETNAKVTIDSEAIVVGSATKKIELINATTYVTIKIEKADESEDKTLVLEIIKSDENTGIVAEDLAIKTITATYATSTVSVSQTGGDSYVVTVPEETQQTTVTIETMDKTSKISIDGGDFATNVKTEKISLENETVIINFTIQNADASESKKYTLTINKKYMEDESVPAEDDPNATFKVKLWDRNDGEIWERTYENGYLYGCWHDRDYGLDRKWAHYVRVFHIHGLGWRNNGTLIFAGEQKLPVFFKSDGIYGSHISWGTKGGYYLLDDFSDMKVEARIVQNDGTVSTDIYETRKLRLNTDINETNGSHTANFKKDYTNKEVEFTIIQNIPVINHKKSETKKIIVKFDNNGNIVSGSLTQGVDLKDIAVGGISAGGVVENIKYVKRFLDIGTGSSLTQEQLLLALKYSKERYGDDYSSIIDDGDGIKSKYLYDEIKSYNSIGTNALNVGILNTQIDNKFNVEINLVDVDTNDPLNGDVTLVVSEKDTTGDWLVIQTSQININDGKGKVSLAQTYANRHLRFTITQTSKATRGSNTYNNPADTSIELELWLDDNGNMHSLREISTPSAKLEESLSGSNTVKYTIYNEKEYNFAINLTKYDENGNPLPGARFETKTVLINNADLSTGTVIDTYGSRLTDENGHAELKIVLPEEGGNKYYGRTIDITLREYYVPDNYAAYNDIKVRVLFTSQGKIAVSPELISEPEEGIVTVSPEFENGLIMKINLSVKDRRITDKPSFEIKNIDATNQETLVGGMQYQITSWDQEEYENNHITYKEQRYTGISSQNDGMTITNMENAHALKTIIYTLHEYKTSESYEENNDIVIKVTYDAEGKIAEMPEILSHQILAGDDVAEIVGNPVGYTMIDLRIRHLLKPKFSINLKKYETKENVEILDKVFRGTSQVKQADGTYGEIEEDILSVLNENTDKIRLGFRTEHQRETVLYTIYEITGNTQIKRGQVEVEFDAYAKVLSGTIVDPEDPKNYINNEHTKFNVGTDNIDVRVNVEELRMNLTLKSTDSSATYELGGATFDIQNQYEEINDTTKTTDVAGKVTQVVGEIYRAETITYTIKQIKAPEDYDLIDDITFSITFANDGSIIDCTPIMVQNKYAIISTMRNEENVDMEMEIMIVPSDRESIVINAKEELDSTEDIPFAGYEISAVIVSPTKSEFELNLEKGTGETDLGPDKRFFNKTILYTIKQTSIAEQYMISDQEIKVTVKYDVDGTIREMYLQNPTDGTVKITDPSTGASSTTMLTECGGYKFQIDMVNKRKAVMQVENQSIEDSNNKLANSEFKIIEQDKTDLYSDTKQTGTDGTVNMYVGPYYIAKDGQEYVEKTYVISNPTPAFGFSQIPESTFKLRYDKNGKVIYGEVSVFAEEYMAIELVPNSSPLYGDVDVRIIIKSNPNLTIGMEAVSEVTGEALTGMKYEIYQSAPTTGSTSTIITDNSFISHADMGPTLAGQTVTYEIVEKETATGYKYKNKDNVIGRFEVTFDSEGHIMNNINGKRVNITYGNEYLELKEGTDKTINYDFDLKIKYEETENFIVKIKNVNMLDYSDYITSDFTVNLNTSSANGTTNENGELALELGKREADEKGTLTITQSNVQGSYAQVNTIALNLTFDENGKINKSNITALAGNYATLDVAYKILQPSAEINTYILELEVYNNPETTFIIENVDQGDDTIKLGSKFTLTATAGITDSKTIETDATTGLGKVAIESVPNKNSVTYTISQNEDSVPEGYEKSLDINFRILYNEDGLIASEGDITNLGNGITASDESTVEFIREDNYTIKIKIKSKRAFGVYIETVDAYNEEIKLGAEVYILESANRKNATLTTEAGVGTANAVLGSNIANSSLTYELKLLNAATAPEGMNQTYYRNNPTPVNIFVTFDVSGNVSTISYDSSNPYISNNCIIETDRLNGVAVKIKIKYIPNLTVNIKRTDTSNGLGISGRRLQLSSDRMFKLENASTNEEGKATFDGGRIAGNGEEVEYTINEITSATDYNYNPLPSPMKVWVTYDEKGNISAVRTDYPDIVILGGIGTRNLEVEIKSTKAMKVILYNTDYYLNTDRLSGKYTITSSKGERTTQIITPESSSAGSTVRGTPITLGSAYAGEDVVYTIHNDDAQYGFEVLNDMQFTIHYETDGTFSIDANKFSDTERLQLLGTNQTCTATSANIDLEVRSKPLLMVKLNVKDITYDQPIEKMGFEITDPEGNVTKVDALTDENGDLLIPVKSARENQIVHYTITHVATNGGYSIIKPLELVVRYAAAGTVDEDGTYIINSDIAEVEANYTIDLYKSTKQRGIKINIKMETKLGIGIYKIDGDTQAPLQGVTFRITEEELIGGSEVNSWDAGTDINGESTTYTRNIGGKVQKVRYTISEVTPPEGYRPIKDIVLDVTFSSDKRVQSVVIVDKPEEVTVNPSNDPDVTPAYDLKIMDKSREMEHIQITVRNDNKSKFKIVNLDSGFKDSGMDVAIEGSEFNVTVAKDGAVIGTYDVANGTQLITDTNGEAKIDIVEAGEYEITFEQIVTGSGYVPNVRNTGYIKFTKAKNEYVLTYKESTDNIRYAVDDSTGEIIIYVYNENNLKINISNVDIDDTSILALNANQKIKAYYGEVSDDVKDIVGNTDNMVEYNNNYSYNNLEGNLSIDLGNTYNFINKKVVFEIETETPPVGYTAIGNVYVVVEFDKHGRIVDVTNELKSERLILQTKDEKLEFSAFIGFGNLNKWHVKIVKESSTGVRLNDTEFKLNTFVNDEAANIGIPVDPETIKTGDSMIGGVVAESGVYEYRGIQTTGNMKIELEETAPAPDYELCLDSKVEITFNVTTDTTDPVEPRPVISDAVSNNNAVTVTADNTTREIIILVINEPQITVELEKVDEDGNMLSGIEFSGTLQVEGDPTTETDLGKVTTGDDGKLTLKVPARYVNTNILVTLKETKAIGYKQAQPIVLRIRTTADGLIDTTNVNIVSGKDSEDGNGGATETALTNNKIDLKVVNILEESYRPFKLQIIKENATDTGVKIAGVSFQVKISPQIGTVVYKILTTDESGAIEVPNIVGEGDIKIELLELMAPNGYILGETEGYFMFTINKSESGLTEKLSSLGEGNLSVDSENKVVVAHIPNEQDKIGIAINKIDENNGSNIYGATFRLVDNSLNDPDYYPLVTTNSKGIAYFAVDKKSEAGKYTYTIIEEASPLGYRTISSPMTIEVEYNEEGYIEDVIENGERIVLTEQKDKYMKFEVTNEPEPLNVPAYTLEIINTDKADNSIIIPNSSFDVTVDNENMVPISKTLVMDNNGSASIESINGIGTISIDIVELLPGEGYQKDTRHKNVVLYRDGQTGRFEVRSSVNAYPIYDEANNKITVYITNEKAKEVYSIILNKVDENGNSIEDENTEFEVTIQDSDPINVKADTSGKIFINNISIPDKDNFEISIKEITAPEGYNKVEREQIISVDVQEVYEEKVLKDVRVKSGNYIEIANKTEGTIEVDFTNYLEGSEGLYLTSNVYTVTEEYVERVPLATYGKDSTTLKNELQQFIKNSYNVTIQDFLNNMQSNGKMKVYDKNGNEITDLTKNVGTGMTIKAVRAEEEMVKTIIVIGDTNGDGKVSLLDVSKVNQHYVGKSLLEGIALKAADINGDGKVSIIDVSQVNQIYVNGSV